MRFELFCPKVYRPINGIAWQPFRTYRENKCLNRVCRVFLASRLHLIHLICSFCFTHFLTRMLGAATTFRSCMCLFVVCTQSDAMICKTYYTTSEYSGSIIKINGFLCMMGIVTTSFALTLLMFMVAKVLLSTHIIQSVWGQGAESECASQRGVAASRRAKAHILNLFSYIWSHIG